MAVFGDSLFSSAISILQSICLHIHFTYDEAPLGCLFSLIRTRKRIMPETYIIVQMGPYDLERYEVTKPSWMDRFTRVIDYLLEKDVRLFVSFIMPKTETTIFLRARAN